MIFPYWWTAVLIIQGHIAFPLILDLFPFVKSGVGINDLDESWQRGQAKVLNERPSSSLNHVNRKYDAKVLNSIYGLMGKNNHTKALGVDELGCTAHEKEFRGESILPPTQSGSNVRGTDIQMQPDDEVCWIFYDINVSLLDRIWNW